MSAAAKETIGFKRKKKQDWFDENDKTITSLIEIKHTPCFWKNPCAEDKRNYQQENAACQRGICVVENTWWQHKSENLQKYAEKRDMRRFYAATKEIFGPTRSSVGSLKNADGSLISDTQGILDLWKSHFESVLNNHPCTIIDLLRNTLFAIAQPSLQELNNAIKYMKTGKAPGPDNILLEFFLHAGQKLKKHLMQLLLKIWETKTVPSDFGDANRHTR